MVSSSCQSSLTSNMTSVLGLVFLCLIHWVEPFSENQDFSGSPWYPSTLFRFTRPSTSSRPLNRPVPLLYGSSINSIQRPFNPFSSLDVQNKTDAFIPIFVPIPTIPETTTTTPATTTTTPITTTLTPITTTSTPGTTTSTPIYATTLPSQSAQFCNPTTAPPCADKQLGFCISDDEYPDDDVKLAMEFSELADQFSSKSIGDDEWISLFINSINNTGCVTTSLIAKPLRARNIDGEWRIIVQGGRNIYQWQQMVICGNPLASCHQSERVTPVFCFEGKCRQMFIVRRLLVFDPCNPDRQLFIDSFKLPSECSCRLSRTPCLYKNDV